MGVHACGLVWLFVVRRGLLCGQLSGGMVGVLAERRLVLLKKVVGVPEILWDRRPEYWTVVEVDS